MFSIFYFPPTAGRDDICTKHVLGHGHRINQRLISSTSCFRFESALSGLCARATATCSLGVLAFCCGRKYEVGPGPGTAAPTRGPATRLAR